MGTPATSKGTDALGPFLETAVTWANAAAPTAAVMVASYKTYPGDTGVLVFTQTFPNALGAWGPQKPTAAAAAKAEAEYLRKAEVARYGAQSSQSTSTPKSACRIVGAFTNFSLTTSANGFTSWVPKTGAASGFDAHENMYCETTPEHTWIYECEGAAGKCENATACEAKCLDLECKCFDTRGGAPAPSPSPKGMLCTGMLCTGMLCTGLRGKAGVHVWCICVD